MEIKKIAAAPTGPPPLRKLTIIMAGANAGTSMMLDGSRGATRVLDVPLNNSPSLVRDLWPDGAEREFTFIYSGRGCPVKTELRSWEHTRPGCGWPRPRGQLRERGPELALKT